MRREHGFTLVELLVVLVLVTILSAVAVGFHRQARDRATDATAQANLRVATPAFEAYHADHGTYAGMTLLALQDAYSRGIQGIEVVSGSESDYCVRSVVAGTAWYKPGPDGAITKTACS